MECRKLGPHDTVGGLIFDAAGTERTGESYHSHDGARGGLMRECGYPAWRVIGLECVGMDDPAGSYRVQEPQH